MSFGRSAIKQGFKPLSRNGVTAINSAQERTADGCIGISVATPHDRVDNTLFQSGRTQKLPEGIAERNQHPSLMVNVIGRW